MFSWLLGYKQEDDPKEEDAKKIEEEEGEIPPPPVLKREKSYYKSKANEYGVTTKHYKECNKDDVIKWKDYDSAIAEIRKELKQLKIETDKKWEARLSPVMETRRKKRRKKNASAVNTTEK